MRQGCPSELQGHQSFLFHKSYIVFTVIMCVQLLKRSCLSELNTHYHILRRLCVYLTDQDKTNRSFFANILYTQYQTEHVDNPTISF